MAFIVTCPSLSLYFLRRPFSSKTPYPLYYSLVLHNPIRKPPNPNPNPNPNRNRKSKYLAKLSRRVYGGADSDSDDPSPPVELHPELVDFPTLHKREEELFFYDAFALPWEKGRHYRMVYELEKKYFPDQGLDRAFVDEIGRKEEEKDVGLVLFEKEEEVKEKEEEKVEEFFKGLKKYDKNGSGGEKEKEREKGEVFLATRRTGLPPKWDGGSGTVVLVNKPKGWTSFTVCGKLRRLVKVQKVGHAGTLDPMATGLLIVCVGKATKIVDRYQGMIKGYSGIFRLGEATSTWDADSPVIQREPWEHIKDVDIRKAAATFCGEIWQVPPMFSAIKVGGEKMYDKARKGEMVELSARCVSIFQFAIERSLDDRQNLMFRVTCSKGTYIRSLCADLGKALGSCAHLTALRRDFIGPYTADDAWEFKELQEQITKGYL